jgi:hypothetical protein
LADILPASRRAEKFTYSAACLSEQYRPKSIGREAANAQFKISRSCF